MVSVPTEQLRLEVPKVCATALEQGIDKSSGPPIAAAMDGPFDRIAFAALLFFQGAFDFAFESLGGLGGELVRHAHEGFVQL